MSLACSLRSHRLAGNPELNDDHIASCLRCQVEAVRYRSLLRQLAVFRRESVDAPPGFAAVVRSGLGEKPLVPKKTSGVGAATAAAGLAAMAGVVALWRRSLIA